MNLDFSNDQAMTRGERRFLEPGPEPQCIGDYYIGDKVEIIRPLFEPADVDGYSPDKIGEVEKFEYGMIVVQCGMRINTYYPEELKGV
jgi:hypothetical protein